MINCCLLGSPTIVEDGKTIFVPNGKISAFLYYLFVKKFVSRDEVAGIFWGDSDDERARISLRNALHKAKKLFSSDIILAPNKTTLILNPDVGLILDIEEFEKNPIDNLYLYKGDFLKGFYVKDSVEFDYFITKNRSHYEDIFIQSSIDSIKQDLISNKTDDIELKISNLLAVDSYNETAHILIMQYYKEKGRYDKIINEYHNFKKMLEDDLGSQISYEVTKLYKEALKKAGENQKEKFEISDIFYNRDYELSTMQQVLDDFESGKKVKSILLRGENGIGKSTLKKRIIQNNKNKFYIFETNCYQIERDFTLSPWMKIISAIDHELKKDKSKIPVFWEDVTLKLFQSSENKNLPSSNILENRENFNVEFINNVLVNAINELGKYKKTIIVMEDICYADEQSLNFIINLILHFSENVIFLLTTSKEKREKIENLIISLKAAEKMLLLDIERFSKQDVFIIVKKALGEDFVNAKEIADIYEKSGGNALFLNEYINLYKNNNKEQLLTRKLSDLLAEKFSFLNAEEWQLVKILSIFYKDISLDILLKLLEDNNAFTILKTLNSLQNINIIEEYKSKNQTYLRFVHNVYKDYIYKTLSMSEKQILNAKIANIFEQEMLPKSDLTEFIKLKYHYEQAGNEMKTLKYDVSILNYHLNYNHEIFPNLDDDDLNRQVKTYIKNDKAMRLLSELENNIIKVKNQIKNNYDRAEMDDIELMFLYCKGRYLIRGGVYTDGIMTMERVISLAKALNKQNMIIAGYKQMVIYGIQINDAALMVKYIVPAMKVCKSANAHADLGVFNRLYGLYHLMKGNIKQAEELFLRAIDIFSDSYNITNFNSISIAASYNYLGEIRKTQRMYKEAMEYFEKSIDLCKKNGVMCLAIFYINAGKTLFLEKDMENSKKYFLMAKEIATEFDSYWKNVVIDAFLSLFSFLENRYDTAMNMLNKSLNSVKTINNPRDIGVVYFIQTIMASYMEKSKENFGDIKLFLNEPPELYFYKSLKYLDSYRDTMEIEYLKSIIN